jgi:hypothetical protein
MAPIDVRAIPFLLLFPRTAGTALRKTSFAFAGDVLAANREMIVLGIESFQLRILHSVLTEAADVQNMPVRAIESVDVQNGFAAC